MGDDKKESDRNETATFVRVPSFKVKTETVVSLVMSLLAGGSFAGGAYKFQQMSDKVDLVMGSLAQIRQDLAILQHADTEKKVEKLDEMVTKHDVLLQQLQDQVKTLTRFGIAKDK